MNNKWIVFVGIFVVGCGVRKNDKETIAVTEEIVETTDKALEEKDSPFLEDFIEIPKQRPVYRATETILTDLIHTKLEVNFDWAKTRMNGVATITAKPHFYDSDSLILDAKGMLINSVKLRGTVLKYEYVDDVLNINLGKTYSRDDEYTIVVDYVACPEERETGGSAAISSDKGLYFINPNGEDKDVMPQIWTQGETEASSVWFPTIDAPNSKTSQEIFITVEDKFVTLSNGKLISSKKIEGGKRVDHWKQELPHAPYLFMMGVGEFKVVKDFYTRPDGSKMEVNYYVEPEWEEYAKAIFGETPEMIKFFSKLTGVEYPWDKYHQIVARDYVSGAMENTGAVIFGDFVYKNKRELLDANDQSTIAHELFHHWFGDLVTCESWSNLPLNESFANYSQYLWDEYRYGLDEADHNAIAEAEGYYQTAQFQGHHDLIWFDYDDKEQMFDGHSYNKGGRILHMLRNYLGDDAFFAGVNNYLEKNKFKPAEFHQLRLAFEEVSGEDLNWFFNQWFLGSGNPVLEFNQEIDSTSGMININVSQLQDLEVTPLYKLPLEIAIFDIEGKHTYPVLLDELEESFSIPYKGKVNGIIYDDQQMLLAKTKEHKSTEMYRFQFYQGKRYAARLAGLKKGSKGKSLESQQLVLDALNDPFWSIRTEAIKKTGKLKDELREKGIEKLKQMVQNDPNSGVRGAALSKLGKLIEEKEAEVIFVERIKNDQSYSVVTSALNNLGQNNPDRAMELAESLEEERSSKMSAGIAQLYAGFAGADKSEYFIGLLNGNIVQGFDKLGVLGSYTKFVGRHEYKTINDAYSVYDELSRTGSFYAKMFLPQTIAFVQKSIESRKTELNEKLVEHEENNDPLYADQVRKEIEKYDSLNDKYAALLERVNAEKEAEEASGQH
ncbi:MAG: M1 family peptidase [Crocinitomicaceae bacterium]|nr:M1 family peptidase [Crocinitomicaceae bacterium]